MTRDLCEERTGHAAFMASGLEGRQRQNGPRSVNKLTHSAPPTVAPQLLMLGKWGCGTHDSLPTESIGRSVTCVVPQLSVGGGGEGGIRTHVPVLPDHPISSRRRYDRFGTSPR
jgi:hypothetical protein